MTSWPVEAIPDTEALHMRVHRQWIKPDGTVRPTCFKNRPDDRGGMSTDWERYSSPDETRQRARRPDDNAIIMLNTGQVRLIPGQRVSHSPIQDDPNVPDNRAHTDVNGSKESDPETQLRFLAIATLVLPLGADA